jgi:hypothetical protein
MERAYMPPAEPPPLEHDAWGAPHPKAAVAGPPARTAGFDSIADYRSLNGDDGPCPKADQLPEERGSISFGRRYAVFLAKSAPAGGY